MAPLVLRQVFGIDKVAQKMTPEEAEGLHDDFAKLVLVREPQGRPLNLAAVTEVIKDGSPTAEAQVFLVGDGSQISYEDFPDLDRSLRFIWVLSARGAEAALLANKGATILIVAGPDTSSDTTFLQVAAWDSDEGWFNYYEREEKDWIWNGNSTFAFDGRSRNKGPFMGHINGSLVMKELRAPWNNWHSSLAQIRALDDNPLSSNPFFKDKSEANDLEVLVEAAVTAWTQSRLDKALGKDGQITDPKMGAPKMLLQHLFTSTTVNFISSKTRSDQQVEPEDVALPLGFFLNLEGLSMPDLALADPGRVDFSTGGKYAVPYETVYQPALKFLGMHLLGRNKRCELVRIPTDEGEFRDTFFAFYVPQFAKEDFEVVNGLLARGVLSKEFVLCGWMVDFCNPVYSPHRLALMKYVPDTGDDWKVFEANTVQAIVQSAGEGNDASAIEFKRWWDIGLTGYDKLADAAAKEINDYLKQVDKMCKGSPGFVKYLRLAEWRRRAFAGHNKPLDEFELTFPRTNILTSTPLQMKRDGDIEAIPGSHFNVLEGTLPSGSKARCQGNRR